MKEDKLKNIIKLRDGAYEIQISNGFRADGKRDRVTETVIGTEEDAIARRDELKAELKAKRDKGINTSNSGYTLLEVAKMFLEDKDFGKRVGTTIKGYKTYLNNYILPYLADKKIRNITEDDLRALYKKLANTPSKSGKGNLTGSTIKHTHTLIGTIFNYAKLKKWVIYNPAEFVINVPKSDAKERDYYDHEEIQLALSCLDKMVEHKNGMSDKILHSQNIRFKTAITILFNSGLRREELFGLKWQDIKYNTGIFQIKRAVVTVDSNDFDEEDIVEKLPNGLVCKKLKNDSSRRDIYMPLTCFDLLTEYKNDQVKCGYRVNDDDFIFQNVRNNTIWNPNYLTSEWRDFRNTFNLKNITIHDIRHSHATDLLSMGVPIQDVSRRLGHSDVSTTLRIYTHSNLGADKLIVDKLEDKYDNNYVSQILDINVLISIITGVNLVDENKLCNAIKYITGEDVDDNNKTELINTSKNYILDKYKYLKDIGLFINSDSDERLRDAFLNILNNIKIDVCEIRPIELMKKTNEF